MASLPPKRLGTPHRPHFKAPWRPRARRPILTLIAAATLVTPVELASSGNGRSDVSFASGDLAGGRYRR
jgi:hypothetical protein